MITIMAQITSYRCNAATAGDFLQKKMIELQEMVSLCIVVLLFVLLVGYCFLAGVGSRCVIFDIIIINIFGMCVVNTLDM